MGGKTGGAGEYTTPPALYFCPLKFAVWAAVARRASEACDVVEKLFAKFFVRLRRDVAGQIVGTLCVSYVTFICALDQYLIST